MVAIDALSRDRRVGLHLNFWDVLSLQIHPAARQNKEVRLLCFGVKHRVKLACARWRSDVWLQITDHLSLNLLHGGVERGCGVGRDLGVGVALGVAVGVGAGEILMPLPKSQTSRNG